MIKIIKINKIIALFGKFPPSSCQNMIPTLLHLPTCLVVAFVCDLGSPTMVVSCPAVGPREIAGPRKLPADGGASSSHLSSYARGHNTPGWVRNGKALTEEPCCGPLRKVYNCSMHRDTAAP